MARKLGVSTNPPLSAVRPCRRRTPVIQSGNRERDPPCRNRTMAGNRSGAILPDPMPASVAARAPVTAGVRVAIPAVRETPAVRVTGVVSAGTTIAAMPAGAANRTPEARDGDGPGPAVADSVVTGPAMRNGPIAPAARSGPDLRGSATAAPTGRQAARVSGPKGEGHGRTGRTIDPVVRVRSRARTVISGSTERVSAGTSGHRGALHSVTRIEAGTIAAPGVRTAGAVRTTAGSVGARPSSPPAVPMSVVSVDGVGRIGPIGVPTTAASAGVVGRRVGARSVASVDAVRPIGRTAGATGRAGTGWGRRRATVVRGSLAVATPEDLGAGAVRVGAVGPIAARRVPMSPTCPTRSRPVIWILRSGATC